jgi:transcriptional regulator with XRE-family HTH domain
MALISMDANGRAHVPRSARRVIPLQRNPLVSFRVENAQKQPTRLGYLLLQEMTHVGIKAAGLARTSGVAPSTITRLIYGGVDRPDEVTLERIARAFAGLSAPSVVDSADLEAAVRAKLASLKLAAGYGVDGVAEPMRRMHRLAAELDLMIGEGSPLDPRDVEFIETMTDRLIEPYRRKMRRRGA